MLLFVLQFALFVICSKVTAIGQDEGDLRLIRGPNRCEGHLQVLVPNNGRLQWSSACDRRFGREELQVVCQQLGCPAGNPQRRTVESYEGRLPRGSVYQAFGFSCEGNEGKVVDCPYTGAVCDLGRNSDIIAVACLEGGSQPATTALTAPGSLSGGYQLRLAGGSDRCQGDLEVYVPFLGDWALALSREFGNDEAAVTCSELGCGTPVRVSTSSRTSGPYLEVGYECNGSENRLQDCSPIPLFSRSSEYYLHVQCRNGGSVPSSPPNTSNSPYSPATTDNSPSSQGGEGDIRLAEGSSRCEGNLEVLTLDREGKLEWFTACHRGFGAEEAQVVCQQIGCPTDIVQNSTVRTSNGNNRYLPFGYTCTGEEENFSQCPYTGAFCDIGLGVTSIHVSCLDSDDSHSSSSNRLSSTCMYHVTIILLLLVIFYN